MTDAGHGFAHGRKIKGSDWQWKAVEVDPAKVPPLPPPVTVLAFESRAKGYTGDPCPACQQFTLRVSGHCQVCDLCGTTTSCS